MAETANTSSSTPTTCPAVSNVERPDSLDNTSGEVRRPQHKYHESGQGESRHRRGHISKAQPGDGIRDRTVRSIEPVAGRNLEAERIGGIHGGDRPVG